MAVSTQKPPRQRRPLAQRAALVFLGFALLGAAGIVIFLAFQATKQVPLEVPLYPNATLTGSEVTGPGEDRLQYVVAEPAHDVGAFYEAESTEPCIYRENTEQGDGIVPFEYQCMFDASDLGIVQYTRVIVQPGVGEREGLTIIHMERVWGQ